MTNDMQEYISDCRRCKALKPKPDFSPLTCIHASHPLELIHLDYLCFEPSKGKEENVFIITDHFTRYVQVYVTQSQTAAVATKKVYDNFIVHYGFPCKLITDQGRNFESKLYKIFVSLCVSAENQNMSVPSSDQWTV